MKTNTPLTQRKLAETLGLSQQTISAAITGTGTVGEKTKTKVLDEAAKLGYRPNAQARAMRTGRHHSTGLVMEQGARGFLPPSLLSGISSVLEDEGGAVTIVSIDEQKTIQDSSDLPPPLQEQRVDGLIVAVSSGHEEFLKPHINAIALPTIWINRKTRWNSAYPDDVWLGRQAAEVCIARGHRQIGYIGPSSNDHFSQQDRLQGVSSAIKDAGLSWSPAWHVQKREDVAAMLSEKSRISAAVCYGDGDAQTLYCEAVRIGLRIPEDLSIVLISHAGSSIGETPFSLVRIPFYQVGRTAQNQLNEMIQRNSLRIKSQCIRHLEFDKGATLSAPGSHV